MSLHKYQYAHANPVVNTDPSGYATNLTELAALAAMTATLGGLGLTTVGAIGVGLNGGSTSDVLSIYDQYFAGMADSLTFGISTQARRLAHGNNATQNHKGLYFNLGRFGGAIASIWIGSRGTTFAKLGSAPWWARAALGYDLFGTGLGIAQSVKNFAKKEATWWDILAFLPFLTWAGVNYKITRKGLSFGINGGDFSITPRNGNSPKLSQVRALRNLGVNRSNRRLFFQGGEVLFEFPSFGGDDVIGVTQLRGDRLSSSIFSIHNTTGNAVKDFSKFRGNSRALARSLNARELQLGGIAIINPDIEAMLLRLGFTRQMIPIPEILGGGGTIEMFTRVFPVR